MLKHKSFVLNCNTNAEIETVEKSSLKSETIAPKKVLEVKKETTVGHYDNNEPISLALPQSLSLVEDLAFEDYDADAQFEQTKSNSQSQSVDNENFYSDANAYFAHEEAKNKLSHLSSEKVVASPQQDAIKPGNAEPVNQKQEISEDKLVLDTEENQIEDKKFEEDIKAIMEGKKVFDKEREKNNPAEILKNKNHGLMDKKGDQKLEEKMKNEHAIFDKIAQSMEMANSYDLGAIAMDKKFDTLEEETDDDFTKKIHDLIGEDKKSDLKPDAVNDATEDKSKEEVITNTKEKKDTTATEKKVPIPADKNDKDDDKILTKDFLKDLDKLNKVEQEAKENIHKDNLSKQSSFTSTISIKHQILKSRIFSVTGSTVQVTIDSLWNPIGCSSITELNVSLSKVVDYLPDSKKGSKRFAIGRSVTQIWTDLEPGNYYLTFYFVANTNPHCELTGTVNVIA